VEANIYKLGGKIKIRWENDIKEDLRIMKINNWTECIQDRVKWKEIVEKAKSFKNKILPPAS
jgi:hypothetical protein